MSAYALFIKEKTKDARELAIYQSQTAKAVQGHNAELLIAYGNFEAAEGSKPEGVVLVKFPNINEAKAWYESSDYQRISQHRRRGATWRVI